ncbi:MAG: RluA family pseudouridine synthase [Xanthomonadaceae bacterium]|nr:RluA family pseudouridine synthase [Xanthomonadaceae bacterium]
MSLKYLYRDKDLIAVHKPAGSVVYRDGSHENVLVLQDHLKEQVARSIFPVHRLDKGTCGVILFALNAEAAAFFQKLFAGRGIKKYYIALVEGAIPKQGKISEPLMGNKDKIKKPAVTVFERLKVGKIKGKEVSLVELRPETGRYHQIRRHLKFLGHPILGDTQYGGSTDIANRTMLSAVCIELTIPKTGKKLVIETQPDQDFLKISSALRGFEESNST